MLPAATILKRNAMAESWHTAEERQEIVSGIFGDIGKLISEDFSCAVEIQVLVHGRLYMSNKGIFFYSNLFGTEKKIKLLYSEIKWWSKINTALIIPNAIEIKTADQTYQFRSFLNRNRTFQLLDEHMNRFHDGEDMEHEDAAAASQGATTTDATAEAEEAAKMNVFQSLMNGFAQRRRSSASNATTAASAATATAAAPGGKASYT